ncbi:MAG: rRNA maturation RNase YbeY [Christensenellales bacterium]
MIELIDEYGAGELADIIKTAAKKVIDIAKAEFAGAEIIIVDDNAMKELNKDTRGIDAATDVLSFPMLEFKAPLVTLNGRLADVKSVFLGSIVISADKLFSQAKSYGHSEGREAAFLAAHGMLHLLGYDHETKEDEAVMKAAQSQALKELGWTR